MRSGPLRDPGKRSNKHPKPFNQHGPNGTDAIVTGVTHI